MLQKTVQLDTPLANAKFGILPKHLPGVVNTDYFIYFHVPCGMDASQYDVVIESMDTSSPCTLRNLGSLSRINVELPAVHFAADARVFVMPHSNAKLPTYYARLNRGSTYVITKIANPVYGQKYEMARHGILTSAADTSQIAYV